MTKKSLVSVFIKFKEGTQEATTKRAQRTSCHRLPWIDIEKERGRDTKKHMENSTAAICCHLKHFYSSLTAESLGVGE